MILFAPAARAALLRGMGLMTDLMRPTIGPVGRTVAIAPIGNNGPPEILDNAATIARRTIQLADPYEDMGAMLVRDLALRVSEQVGDGGATAAVLAHSLVRAAARCAAAGCSPVLLRHGIERGLQVARSALERQAHSIESAAEIADVVAGSLRNARLAAMVGEIVDSVGSEGAVLFENAAEPTTSYEYVDGVRWNEGYLSYFLLKPGETTGRLLNPRVLLTDHPVERAEQLVPALEACVAAGDRDLLVIAPEVRDSAMSLLVVNRERGLLDGALAVKAPTYGEQQTRILEDLALLTGGRCVHAGWGESLASVTGEHLGRARQAWATRAAFGIVGGLGRKEAIRERIAEIRAELRATRADPPLCAKLRERIGNLSGMSAVVRVGAPTPGEQVDLRLRLEAAVMAGRLAVERGVVPGGGGALVGCIPSLEALELELVGDEAAGVRMLVESLTEPMRAIVANAGLEADPIVYVARSRGPGWTFDVLRREWLDASRGGVVDPLSVALAALDSAVSAAAAALTADVLVVSHP
ncbi:MAG: chaperonin GroEL [Chloroflexi bacterium]|nr:chaperonin GroEL [Chloroflexota bacterium]